MTDERLLEKFIERQDEAAFEALTRLHGEMVLGVALRVLGNLHDAEDAFQATFLVLARKAASIVPRSMVGNWLYGVVYRIALRAKVTIARRQGRERHMPDMPEPTADTEAIPQHWLVRLEEELGRLPDEYRLPILLCDLDGRTQKEAAEQLGWPQGTVSVRLMRARDLLAKRLRREGTAFSIAALSMIFLKNAQQPCQPSELLVISTAKAASSFAASQETFTDWVSPQVLALTKGVLKSMASKYLALKITAASLAALVGIGAVGLFFQMHASEPQKPASDPPKTVRSEDKNEVNENVKSTPELVKTSESKVPVTKPVEAKAAEIKVSKLKVSEKVREELGARTVDILLGAQRVEAFLVKEIEPGEEEKAVHLEPRGLGRWAITATAKERGPEFAAKVKAVVLDEATCRPTGPGFGKAEIAFRLWKGKESVTLIVDFTESKFLFITRDAQGQQIGRNDFKQTLGSFLFNAKGEFDDGELFARVKAIAIEAFPNDRRITGLTDFAGMLDKAEQFELLTLNPSPIGGNVALLDKNRPKAPNEFHGFRILGKTLIKDPIARKMLVGAFKQGIEKGDDSMVPGYNPRHGIRMTRDGKTADLLISFESLMAQGFVGNQPAKYYRLAAEPGEIFTAYLRAAKVPTTEDEQDAEAAKAPGAKNKLQGQQVPARIRNAFGDRTIDILSRADRVDAYRLQRTDLDAQPDILGTNNEERWTITAKAKKDLQFAAKVRSLLFEPATRKLRGIGILDGQVGYQLWKGKESVTVIFDFPGSGFLVLGRDVDGKLISGVQGQFLVDTKGKLDNGELFARAKTLASEAFPNDKSLTGLTDFAALLDKADQIELLSLDPTGGGFGPPKPDKAKPGEEFHQYKILGSTVVKDAAARQKLVSSFKKAIEEAPEMAAGCFTPRHGLRVTRAGKTAEYVICFECLSSMVYIDDKLEKTYRNSGDPAETFNNVLKKAKVPLPKQPEPEEDKE